MGKALDRAFWEERWKTGQTGWDMGQVSPPIKAYIQQMTDKQKRILIPGCGNTYEAEYLLQQGFTQVTVVDISATLTQRLKEKFASQLDKAIRVIHADFFDLQGQFDLIFEQTFFCTFLPEVRPKYVAKMKQLLAPGGKLVGVLFNVDFGPDGPPFGGSWQEYRKCFENDFTIHTCAPCYNSHPARMGNELFINLIKKETV